MDNIIDEIRQRLMQKVATIIQQLPPEKRMQALSKQYDPAGRKRSPAITRYKKQSGVPPLTRDEIRKTPLNILKKTTK